MNESCVVSFSSIYPFSVDYAELDQGGCRLSREILMFLSLKTFFNPY